MQSATLLHTLQQFPQGRTPGTTTAVAADGAAAAHAAAATPLAPDAACTARLGTAAAETTYGFAAHLATLGDPPVRDTRHCIAGDRGIMAFYSAGAGDAVSDNGRADAQQFYSAVRPLEGAARGARASRRTGYGAAFPKPSLVV